MASKNKIKQLEKLAGQTDKVLTKQIGSAKDRMRRALERLEKKIINLSASLDYDADGKLKGPKWTLKQATQMHAKTAVLFEQIYGEAAHKNVGAFSVLAGQSVKSIKAAGVPVEFSKINKQTVSALEQGSYQVYHSLGVDAQNKIAQAVYDSVIAGTTFSELSKRIKGAITGHEDVKGRPLAIYADLYAQDSVMNTYRAMHLNTAKEAGLEHFLYTGTIMDGTRSFCRIHINKYYSMEEIEAMDAQDWSGKSGPPLTNCGGYNCRHHWQAVDPEWLEEEEEDEPKPEPKPEQPREPALEDQDLAFTPGKQQGKSLNGVPFEKTGTPPLSTRAIKLDEPAMPFVPGKQPASGVIIEEPDGRIWLIEPRNHFGGVKHTFPKGKLEAGLSLQENAVKEAWEETGLDVEITGWFGDVQRDTSVTRYYKAKRVGGAPWDPQASDVKDLAGLPEVQSVKLVTPDEAKKLLNIPVDGKLVDDITNGIVSGQKHLPFAARTEDLGLELLPDMVGGSTGAKVMRTKWGEKVVVKDYGGRGDQVRNEYVANRLYTKAGVKVPDTVVSKVGDRDVIVSKWLDDMQEMGLGGVDFAADTSAVKNGFAVDAWLANWDVAGLGFDNIVMQSGRKSSINRIDQGGALLFRAQGTPKGGAFGKAVTELESLRDQAVNPQSARLFAKVTDDDVARQVRGMMRKIKPNDIDDIVAASGMTGDQAKQTRDLLLARRQWLSDWEKKHMVKKRASVAGLEVDPGAPSLKPPVPRGVSPAEIKAVSASRQNGLSIPTDAEDIEDHHLHLWHETDQGQSVTVASLKLRGDALKRLSAEAAANNASGPQWISGGLDEKLVSAMKGIGMQANNGDVIRGKDVSRAKEAIAAYKAAKKKLAAEIKAGTWKKGALENFDSKYSKWVDDIEAAVKVGEGNKAIWKPHSKKLFAGGFMPEASPVDRGRRRRWDSKNATFKAKRISRGRSEVLDHAAYSSHDRVFEIENDGVKLRFHPDNDETRFALRGLVEVRAPGQDEGAVSKLLDALDGLGVSSVRSTVADREELYLNQIAHHRKEGWSKFNKLAGKDQAERIAKKKAWLSKEIGSEVEKLPGYNPAGDYQAYGHGRRLLFRPDLVGQEWNDFEKKYVLHHGITNGAMVDNIDAILNSGGMMAATTDKLRRGINLGGMSPEADLGTGGASYVFTRIQSMRSARNGVGINWKAKHLGRLDAISYDGDMFGKVNDGATAIQRRRKSGVNEWMEAARRSGNETILKNSLSIFDDVDSIVVHSRDYQGVLDTFKRHGYKKWPDGRELTDVIKKI